MFVPVVAFIATLASHQAIVQRHHRPTLAQLEERETVTDKNHLEVACSSQAGRILFFVLARVKGLLPCRFPCVDCMRQAFRT